jgi:flavorubredoxin
MLCSKKVIFVHDSFGSYYSPIHDIYMRKLHLDEELICQESLHFYYTAIFRPFEQYIIHDLEKFNIYQLNQYVLDMN